MLIKRKKEVKRLSKKTKIKFILYMNKRTQPTLSCNYTIKTAINFYLFLNSQFINKFGVAMLFISPAFPLPSKQNGAGTQICFDNAHSQCQQ